MQNLNPNPSKYREPRSFNSNCYAERLGFAMRDEQTTDSTVKVAAINPLGADVGHVMSALQDVEHSGVSWDKTYAKKIIIPGIMTFDFEPVFAPQSGENKQIVEDIFNNLWSVYRIYYNGADDIQPADIAIRCMAQMLIDTYIATIRRVLDVAKLAYSANNDYVRNTVYLEALGFTGLSDFDIRSKFTTWVNYFNDSILGALNAQRWIGGIFPGEKRWASLCSEIYKDESIDSDYVQTYLFKMRSFYSFITEEVEPGIYAWKLKREDPVTDFDSYLTKVHDFIRAVYYDSSAQQIQAMLQTIEVRSKGAEGTHIYHLEYDLYPLTGNKLMLTYDWNMLVAIHNSSVMYGLRAFDVSQDPATGRVTQYFEWDETGYSRSFFMTPKLVNLPNFAATKEQFINATQWTIIGQPEDVIPGTGINPRVLGSDVLVDARILTYDVRDNTIVKSPIWQLFTYYMPDSQGWSKWNGEIFHAMAQLAQFNMHPMIYLDENQSPTDISADKLVTDIIGEIGVLYRADAATLQNIKHAFVNNFWGYPITLRSEGSFTLQNKIEQTEAGIGVGSNTESNSVQ